MIKIDKDSKEVSGIYLIYNKISDKGYVGSSKNVIQRIFQPLSIGHIVNLRRNTHKNIHLQASFNKHGEEAFEYYLLCSCPKEYNLKMEQFFIDNYKSEFNMLRTAGSPLGNKMSEETKAKISKKTKGRKGKLGKENGFSKPVYYYDSNGILCGSYDSGMDAVRSTGIPVYKIRHSTINNKERNYTKAGDYYWKVFNDSASIPFEIEISSVRVIKTIVAENESVCYIFKGYPEAAKFVNRGETALRTHITNKSSNEIYNGYKWKILN